MSTIFHSPRRRLLRDIGLASVVLALAGLTLLAYELVAVAQMLGN